MKPHTRFQHKVAAVNERLSPITEAQKQWGFRNALSHFAIRNAKGVAICLDCGHQWHSTDSTEGETKCPNCGTPYKGKETKCSLCGRKVRTMPTLPFKMNMISWYTGEKKLGIAQATGTMTIMEDRLEFRRRFGNSAALLTPYTAVYSAAKANKQPKDILWMRDIADARVGKYGANPIRWNFS